jgi:hypothetical protein
MRYRGGWGGHPRGGFVFIFPLLFMAFLFFTLLKFLWPLFLVGLVIFLVRRGMGMGRGGWGTGAWSQQQSEGWGHGRWGWDGDADKPKRKNDEDDDKPKRDGNTLYV